jgi:hypothetical protein
MLHLETRLSGLSSDDQSGIASDHFDLTRVPGHRASPYLADRRGPVMNELVPAEDHTATYAAPLGRLVPEELGVKVTAAFAVRFPPGSNIPGTDYRVGRWGDVSHFAPIDRDEVELLSSGALAGLTTLCRITFTFADVEHVAGDKVFRKVVCDRCLLAAHTLPELLLL